MEPVLRVSGLTKKYKNNRGIKDVHFTIGRGEVLGLLGPNGAGKTTLMKCLVGLTRPDSGKVEIFGHDLTEDYKAAIAQVGTHIGTGALYDYLTAYQNLTLVNRFYRDNQDSRIHEVLAEVGLGPYKNEKVGGYSMGMKQRLGIASAILARPSFVILDEPANGLDIDGMILFRAVIRRLAGEGTSFLISSHLTSELEKMCSRYAILLNGEITEMNEMANDQNLEQLYIGKVRRESIWTQ
jgi:ABC-2 type transport system ATP-binding protein